MTVLDVFSWLSEKEIGIEEIENIFLKSYERIADNTYEIVYEIPENTETDMIDCKNELLSEGKKVAYMMRAGVPIAVIGYRD